MQDNPKSWPGVALDAWRRIFGIQRSCSMRMSEVMLNTGDVVWTQKDAQCTVTADATYYRAFGTVTHSAKMACAIAAAVGLQAYKATAAAMSMAGVTHLKFWIYSSRALAAGEFSIGVSNDAAPANAAACVLLPIPAIAATTWTRVVVPVSAAWLAAVPTSVDAVGLSMVTDTGVAVSIYLNDIRACTYTASGSDAVTLPSTCTLNNTNADTINTDLWLLPFRSRAVTIHKVPQDIDVKYWEGAALAAWASTDTEGATDPLYLGQAATDLDRRATAISFVLGADLASGEEISIGVVD